MGRRRFGLAAVAVAASSGYCTSAQVPCSFGSLGTPGRVNSVYPNGDNMRDIPDSTELVPEWVWRYYEQSGDRATLAASYDALTAIASYLKANAAGTGLVTNLFGGSSSYQYGLIDWPAQMRSSYTFTGNAGHRPAAHRELLHDADVHAVNHEPVAPTPAARRRGPR
jgi:hypothetical protein